MAVTRADDRRLPPRASFSLYEPYSVHPEREAEDFVGRFLEFLDYEQKDLL